MSADNDLLLKKPMEFFKHYAVSPPDDAGGMIVPIEGQRPELRPIQTLSPSLEIWSDPNHIVLPKDVERIDYQIVKKNKVVFADVQDVPRDKPGAKTFKISGKQSGGLVPIYYLPWSSGKLIEIRLEDVKADMDNIDEFPRLFFTAALSGCSVYVDGDPARPRIVHAGINGALKDDAANFWRRMLSGVGTKTGRTLDDHLQEVNKSQYMNTVWGMAFKNFLQADHKNVLTIQDVKEWASVFGIRFGRLWSFYLQRNATVSTLRVVKKSQVSSTTRTDPTGSTTEHSLKGTPFNVDKVVQKGKGFLGSSKTIYIAKEQFAKPLIIEEFYPTGKARIQPARSLLVT